LLHEPTIRLKESGHGRQQLLRELFGLDEAPAEVQAPPTEVAPHPSAAADNVRPLKRRA
jgi:hypothetical protein